MTVFVFAPTKILFVLYLFSCCYYVLINCQVFFTFPFVYIDHFSDILAVVFTTVVGLMVMLIIIVGSVIVLVDAVEIEIVI